MKIAITTLGCKVNQYDSAVIQNRLEQHHAFVSFEEPADCYIINACTVTDRADWEARQLVRRAKRLSPGAKVLVTGCYAQVNPAEVARVPGVDYVVGLNRLADLLQFVDLPVGDGEVRVAVSDVKRERGVTVLGTRALPGHTRAFLKIQEGCNYSCTYCIIPTARGLSRSVAPREVLEQVRTLADAGLVDTVEVALMPVLLSQGVPLITSGTRITGMKLDKCETLPKSGIVMLSYTIPLHP